MIRWLRSKGRRAATLARRPGDPDRPGLEVQVHPADIRKNVRYLFLSHWQVFWIVAGSLAFIGFLLLGLWLAPTVIRSAMATREYDVLKVERAQQGRRLQALVERFDGLDERSEELRLELQKVFLAYGLDDEEATGRGGYPFEAKEAPDSIYGAVIQRGNDLSAKLHQQLHVIGVFVSEVHSFESAYQDQVRSTPSIKPLPAGEFVLTSPFGQRVSPFTSVGESHSGIDLAAPAGTSVFATADGVVVFAGRFPQQQSMGWWRYGNLVVIRHGESFITLYGHCDQVIARQGQRIERGDLIATVGSTGWSTNPHLHYEVRRRDGEAGFQPVDPRIYILDHRWDDQERLLIRARTAPQLEGYDPLPRLFQR
jgi:murein DD-endopeptidase MepM/ murein hydrolase activator NlpD